MPSSRPYILDRLREIFSAKIKNYEHYVVYSDLPSLVRSKTLRSNDVSYSPFRRSIRDVVAEEICYGRLYLDTLSYPSRLYFTPEGARFYANYRATIPQHWMMGRPPRPDGPFRKAAIDEYTTMANTVKSIQEAISPFISGDMSVLEVQRLPQTIRAQLEHERALRAENSTLVINLVALNGEVDDLREESLDFYRSEESSTADEAGSLMYPDEDAETSVHGSFDEEFIETDDEILINVGPEITFPDSDDDSRCSICGGSCCSEDTDVEM